MSSATAPKPHNLNLNGYQSQSDTPSHLLVASAKEKGKAHIACVEWYVPCMNANINLCHSLGSN